MIAFARAFIIAPDEPAKNDNLGGDVVVVVVVGRPLGGRVNEF